LLYQAAGYSLEFLILRGFVRNEVHKILEKLKPKEITTLELTNHEFNNLNWLDEKEFSLNGNLYDVVEIKNSLNKKIIYCYLDKKESKLLSEFNSENKRETEQHKIKFSLPNIYCNIPQSTFSWALYGVHKLQYHTLNQSFISNNFSEIISPPPESAY